MNNIRSYLLIVALGALFLVGFSHVANAAPVISTSITSCASPTGQTSACTNSTTSSTFYMDSNQQVNFDASANGASQYYLIWQVYAPTSPNQCIWRYSHNDYTASGPNYPVSTIPSMGFDYSSGTLAGSLSGCSPFTNTTLPSFPESNIVNLNDILKINSNLNTPVPLTVSIQVFNASASYQGRDWNPYGANETVNVIINPILTAPKLTVSSNVIGSGESILLTASSWYGGTSPYTVSFAETQNQVDSCSSLSPALYTTTETSNTAVAHAFSGSYPQVPGTYYFCASVTDNSLSPVTTTSKPIKVVVNPPLGATLNVSSSVTMDAGQTLTLVANAVGGTGTYTYSWQLGSSTNCPGIVLSSTTNTLIYKPTGSSNDCGIEVNVNDGLTSTQAGTGAITINKVLNAPTVSPLPVFMDMGQAITLKSNTNGGTGSYGSYLWTAICPGTFSSANAPKLTYTPNLVGSCYAEMQVNDIGTTKNVGLAPYQETNTSSVDTITVNTALTAPLQPTVTNTIMDQGETTVITSKLPSSGTPPYTYNWLVSTDGGATYSPATSQCGSTASGTAHANEQVSCIFKTNTLTSPLGGYYFELRINDSTTKNAIPREFNTSARSTLITLNQPLVQPPMPTASNTVIDQNQSTVISTKIPNSELGSGGYAYEWLYSLNGGANTVAPRSLCAVNSSTSVSQGAVLNCVFNTNILTKNGVYEFSLKLNDTVATTPTSILTAPVQVTLYKLPKIVLTSSTSQASIGTQNQGKLLDSGQYLTYTVSETEGAGPFSISLFNVTTGVATSQTGSGVLPITVSKGSSGSFTAFQVTNTNTQSSMFSYNAVANDLGDHNIQFMFSSAPNSVVVNSTLTSPTMPIIATTWDSPYNSVLTYGNLVDVNQTVVMTSSLPTTGTYPYEWVWQVSTDSGSTWATAPCIAGSAGQTGSGTPVGSTLTCQFAADMLPSYTSGQAYLFQLKLTDSATTNMVTESSSNSLVVNSMLTQAQQPSISTSNTIFGTFTTGNILDQNQVAQASTTLQTTGTHPYTYNWLVETPGSSSFVPATTSICQVPSGIGIIPGAFETCVFATNVLTHPGTYGFEMKVTDSATTNEVNVSLPSYLVLDPIPRMYITASNVTVDQSQLETLTSTLFNGTGPFVVNFIYTNNGAVMNTVTNVPLNSIAQYTFNTVNTLDSGYSVNAIAMDLGTTTPFTFPLNASFNWTASGNLQVQAPSGYPMYICAGASGNGGIIPSWAPDASDSTPYSAVGRSSSSICSISTTSPDLALVALGVNGIPYYFNANATTPDYALTQSLKYGVSASNSNTLIVASCGWFNCAHVNVPNGCVTKLIYTGKDGYESVYIAECDSQKAGTYNVNLTMSDIGGASIAAYVFDTPLQTSNLYSVYSGENGTNYFVYGMPTTQLLIKASNGTYTNNVMYGSGFDAYASTSEGSGIFNYSWFVNNIPSNFIQTDTTDAYNSVAGPIKAGNYTYVVNTVDEATTTLFNLTSVSNTVNVFKNNTLYASITYCTTPPSGGGSTTCSATNPNSVGYYDIETITFNGLPTLHNQSKWTLKVTGPAQNYPFTSNVFHTNSVVSVQIGQGYPGLYTFKFYNGNANYTNVTYDVTLAKASTVTQTNHTVGSGYTGGGSGGSTGSSGGGGGSAPAGGSGSTFKPLVTPTTGGFNVTNVTQLGTFNITLCGTKLNVTENYITPTYTGVTINGNEYSLTVGQQVQINGLAQGCYVSLTNITYIPIIQTTTLRFFENIPSMFQNGSNSLSNIGVTFSITPSGILNVSAGNYTSLVTITNVTSNTPVAPHGWVKIDVLNITASNSISSTATLNITAKISCTLSNVQPYILENGTWTKISGYSFNSSACTVTFAIPADPIVALMETVSQPAPLQKQNATASTIPSTTVQQTTAPQKSNSSYGSYMIGAAVLVVIIIAIVVLAFSARKGNKGPRRRRR